MASGMGRAEAIVSEAVSAVEQETGATIDISARDSLIRALEANSDFMTSAGVSEHALAVQAASIMLGDATRLRVERAYAGKGVQIVGEAELLQVRWLWPFGKA